AHECAGHHANFVSAVHLHGESKIAMFERANARDQVTKRTSDGLGDEVADGAAEKNGEKTDGDQNAVELRKEERRLIEGTKNRQGNEGAGTLRKADGAGKIALLANLDFLRLIGSDARTLERLLREFDLAFGRERAGDDSAGPTEGDVAGGELAE